MACYTVEALSERVGGTVIGDREATIYGLSSLSQAGANELACVFHKKQERALLQTKASCFLVGDIKIAYPQGQTLIKVSDPREAFALLSPLFEATRTRRTDIDDSVRLGEGIQIATSVLIGPSTVIGDNVSIGKNTAIGPNVVIGDNVLIGDNVVIDAGVVIGASPFNPLKTKGVWSSGQSFGSVIIEDDVAIGANTVIDRGVYSDTTIEKGVKIDNLVQVAHDVIIGTHSIVIACSAIGANTVIGEHCSIGGGASIAGQLTIEDNVSITGTAVVTRSVRKQGVYSSGTNIEPHKKWRKNVARFHRLDLMALRLRRLEKSLQAVLERVES